MSTSHETLCIKSPSKQFQVPVHKGKPAVQPNHISMRTAQISSL